MCNLGTIDNQLFHHPFPTPPSVGIQSPTDDFGSAIDITVAQPSLFLTPW